ncbi:MULTISPECIES: GNAT family N-acetyltransferase [unclassified Pseudoalteromonas]|uniref:GNAT family N-acetyltransferase n=1 Tax=unclassified Pseudoalteromonas TaxID=194690 RepID=UPI002098154B|nr:GNAT family N-acetyltransferase [Pseudoalteromonas sp. XMcav2-N]MCO7188435.1 GNAT family N-acetyltransferase [Pseudoalteromonas sp. XMcav2-N]
MKVSDITNDHSDIEVIANWYYQQWDSKDPHATVQSVVDKISSSDSRTGFAAYIDNELVGAGEIKQQIDSHYSGNLHWLDGVYVPTEHRGKGISTALIEFAIAKAAKLKLPALHLRCEAHLVKLYESHGFSVVAMDGQKFIMAHALTS